MTIYPAPFGIGGASKGDIVAAGKGEPIGVIWRSICGNKILKYHAPGKFCVKRVKESRRNTFERS